MDGWFFQRWRLRDENENNNTYNPGEKNNKQKVIVL